MTRLVIQAVLFDNKKFNPATARHYLEAHNIKRLLDLSGPKPVVKRVHQTDKYYRYRIRDPKDFKPDSFRIVPIGEHIKYIMGLLLD